MTDIVTITGDLMWGRNVYVPETDQWGNTKYSIAIKPIKEDVEKLMDIQARGCKNTLKKDNDDGRYMMTFSRKDKDGPPDVFKADGLTKLTEAIGNNSKGMIKVGLESFVNKQQIKVNVARLEAVKVDELIVYEGTKDKPSAAGF